MDHAALDWATTTILGAAGPPTPSRVLVLLHEYARTARADVGQAAESALTRALEEFDTIADPIARCEWLGVFVAARVFAADPRLQTMVDTALGSVIDGVEHSIRASYEPGDGLLERSIDEHIRVAGALVTAFELTGRLPYSMLAEELYQHARRRAWRDLDGALGAPFAVNCAASVLCSRLAVLHGEPEYMAAAVVAATADYARDAERLIRWASAAYQDHADAAADFGLALVHWFALGALPN